MSLQIVYGRSGSGKSSYLFNQIKQDLEQENKIYMITPEQFSFTAEKKLLEIAQSGAVLNAEVLTFQRMAYRVMQEVGGATKTNLEESGRSMLIYHILNEQKKNLKFLGKSEENIEVVLNSITEFKKHGIHVEQLVDAISHQENRYLSAKLEDMRLIYEEYEKQIQNQFIDENDILDILVENLEKTNQFTNAVIYIDEFAGFIKQEYQIIEKLLKVAKKVIVTITADFSLQQSQIEHDLFYSNKETAKRLMKLARENGIEIQKEVRLENSYRFKTRELAFLEQNLYQVPYHKYEKSVENISLFLAQNPYSEIEQVASQILSLVQKEGYRYQDISVITKNIDTYGSLAKVIFERYHIPVFIDEKRDLSQNILVKYLLSIMEVFAQNWSYESVISYIKNGFLEIPKQDLFYLENYCKKWDVKRNKWYEKDWDYGEIKPEEKEKIDKLNQMRKIITQPLIDLKQKIQKNKTVKEMTKAIYEFFIQNQIPEKLERKIEELTQKGELELAEEYTLSFDTVIHVLDEFVLVFEDQKISFDEYSKILKIGFRKSPFGKIPATNDGVVLGDVNRSRTHKVKAIFIIGLNDGSFPSINREEGFLDDQDRESLKEQGLELAKTTLEQMYEENFNIYKAFTTAEQKLYLSYASSDIEGKTLRGSILVSRLKKIFPKLKEQSDLVETKTNRITTKEITFEELLNQLERFRNGEEINPIWFQVFFYYHNSPLKEKLEHALASLNYTNLPETINKENIDKLYGDTLKTSISRLEQYQSCPFSYYLKYGLRLEEKDTFKIEMVDTGSFMHDIIDQFFEQLKQENISVKKLSQEEIDSRIEQIIEDKLSLGKNYIFTSTPKYRVLVERLKRVVKRSMRYIIASIQNSDFEIVGNELEFKEGKEYEPIKMELEDGRKVEITGKIDRLDLAENEDGKYIRIIDYKSSVKNVDFNEVEYGIRLQLLTYLDAISTQKQVEPAGILYFNLIEPMIKVNQNMSEEMLEEEIRKKFKMNGLVLADVKVVKMMDHTLETGRSNVIPAYIDKEGKVGTSGGNTVTKEEFSYLQKYTCKMIKQIAKQIYDGRIDLAPYYNLKNKQTPCTYCKYKTICQFSPGFCHNSYQFIPNLEKKKALEEIKNRVEE